MKKLLLTIFTLVYLVSATGIAMDVHFCMGKRTGVDFFTPAGKACGLCGMAEKKGCCNDEHRFYKLDDAHKNVVPATADGLAGAAALATGQQAFISLPLVTIAPVPLVYVKPPPPNLPIFILHSVFLI